MKPTTFLLPFLTVLATAQDPAARLREAVAIEEHEHDPSRAMAVYEALSARADLPDDLRREATLRLGQALLSLGEPQRAESVLQPLVKAGGAWAARARQAIAGQDQDDGFKKRVEMAMATLLQDEDKGMAELQFLGRPAVPVLTSMVLSMQLDRDAVERGAKAMVRLGGEAGAEGLRALRASTDVFVRRAAAEGLAGSLDPAVSEACLAYLDDADAQVRATALKRLNTTVPVVRLVRMLAAPEVEVQEVAVAVLADERRPASDVVAALPALERLAAGRDPRLARGFGRCLRLQGLWHDARGRELGLRLLTWAECSSFQVPEMALPADAHVDTAVAVAEELAGRNRRAAEVRGLDALLRPIVATWGSTHVRDVLRLADAGFPEAAVAWLPRHAGADNLPAIVERPALVDALCDGDGWLLHQPLPAGCIASLVAQLRGEDPSEDPAFRRILLLTQIDDPAATRALVGLSDGEVAYQSVVHTVARRLNDEQWAGNGALWDAAAELVGRGSDGQRSAEARRTLLAVLMFDPARAASRIDDAFRAGLQLRGTSGGLADLVPSRTTVGPRGVRGSAGELWSEDQLATAVRECLALGQADVWLSMVDWVQRGDWLPVRVYRLLCEGAVSMPEIKIGNSNVTRARYRRMLIEADRDRAAADAMALAVLDGAEAEERAELVGAMLSRAPRSAAMMARLRELAFAPAPLREAVAAIGRLGDADADGPRLLALLRHDDAVIRREAVRATTELLGARAVPELARLATDDARVVRLALCDAAERLLDPGLAPALIQLLRDPSAREAAQKALEATDFYVTQTTRWQRMLAAGGLEEASAAEALVRQARSGERKVRLLAIRSLGALKAPETLPFLIELVQSGDAEIAAAAEAAIAAIHGR